MENNTNKRTLVVYGNLMKGGKNHKLLSRQEFLGKTSVYGMMQSIQSRKYLFDTAVSGKTSSGFLYDAEGYLVEENVYQDILNKMKEDGHYEKTLSTKWGLGYVFLTQPIKFSEKHKIINTNKHK
jgi:gamma-glutamylcyclotransferase (GGCT)/AIG2-like uncharacterized protein YtfP